MSTLTIELDDEAARLVAKAAQAVKQPLEHWLRQSICPAAAHREQSQSCEPPHFAPASGRHPTRAGLQHSERGVSPLRLSRNDSKEKPLIDASRG
jgi:hypothetical protein